MSMEILHTAEFESPIGTLRIASTQNGLAYIQLPHASGRGFMGWRRLHAPASELVSDDRPNRHCITQILEFLEGERREFDLPLDLRGTPFQLKVYDDVASIPYGTSRSYGEVAKRVGSPGAARAVGTANGANPIPLVVPCHRVIGSDGQLHGYAGGLETKARLLAMEQSAPVEGRLF
jgi:O-6-methylguanine DNA methyltransferase